MGRQWQQFRLLDEPAEKTLIEVIAAQCGVAAGCEDFKHTFGQLEKRDVKGASTQVIYRVDTLRSLVESVRHRSRRRLA